ncbi:hypothetical protein Bca4012_001147 [Brassica carinata]
MEHRKAYVLVALFALLLLTDIVIAASDGGKGNGNNGQGQVEKAKGGDAGKGKGNGNGPQDKEKEKKDKKEKDEKEKKAKKEKEKKEKEERAKKDKERKEKEKKEKERKEKEKRDKEQSEAAARYRVLSPLPTGQEQAMCQAKGPCYYKTLVCPGECPKRKPTKNRNTKGCFIDCTSKCEATCKWRKPNCNGYGSLCYDPRDFTWVQALSVMFENHNLVMTANRVTQWDENSDAFTLRYNEELITLPEDEQTEWRATSGQREIVIERTDERNSVRVLVSGLVQMDIRVRPIGKEENRVHNYQLPQDDAFAHLETQFKFLDLSELVEGVLGKTYRPDYVSSAKVGVPMPVVGGEDKYQTPSLFSPTCRLCRFKPQEKPLSADI